MILRRMTKHSTALDRVYAALADSSRRAIVARLVRGPASVSELARPLPMSLPSVFQHLKVLEECGLIRSRKRGRVRTCSIVEPQIRAARDWLDEQRAEWEARFDRFDRFVMEDGDE